MHLSTAGLAGFSARHPWRVLGAWLIVLVAGIVLASGLADVLTSEANLTTTPDSIVGSDLLKERLRANHDEPLTETVIVTSEQLTVDDARFKQTVEQTTADLAALGGIVASASNYYQTQDGSLVSADKHTTLIPVTLAGSADDADEHADDYMAAVSAHSDPAAGINVLTIGATTVNHTSNTIAQEDLPRGELIGVGVGLLILIVVLGALVAAGLPILLGVVSIVVAFGLAALVGRTIDLSIFVENIISMIGLAVGIDYALFVVERYREERRRGLPKIEAITVAGGTATKAVVFSGCTVILALCGMFLVPISVFRSLGIGAILVVLAAVAATATLVPAMLSLLGDKLEWPRKRPLAVASVRSHLDDAAAVKTGFWGRVTGLVMGHPVIAVVLAGSLLLAASIPYFDLQRGETGAAALPQSDVKTAYLILERDFNAGRLDPVEIVVDGAHSQFGGASVEDALTQLTTSLRANPAYARVDEPQWNDAGDLALVNAWLVADSSSPSANAAIADLREHSVPNAFQTTSGATRVYVTGATASNVDFVAAVDSSTPTVFLFVLGLSFVLLTLVFRSLVIPVTAIIMNLLSVGAAYGLMVLVFQKGYGTSLLGFQQTPVITSWVPIFLFCILFGLSMDYHVFLLSRIREHFDATGDSDASVAVGLQSTAKIITGAALIMVAVFGSFATGRMADIQQVGLGLAVAIFLDATVVRSLLVPAAMKLLGNRNWYLPRWLRRLPDLRIEGDLTRTQPAPVPVYSMEPAGDD
jgi:RND superfamily putative drug exporter